MSEIAFIVPGRLDQLTGGYLYDRHIVMGLRARGCAVRVIELPPAANAEAALLSLPDGTLTVIDGLAVPHLEKPIAAHGYRLRVVGLIHHPLSEETGLSRTAAARVARIEATALPRFRGILCPSRKTATALERYGVSPDRIVIAPPGTAKPMRFRRPRRRRSQRPRPRALLCVASLIPRKGHRVLIRALANIRDLDWTLRCIGSLERHPATVRDIRRIVFASGLRRRITLAGEQPPPEVARAYGEADIFVLPSFHEGYGMAFAEAMAYGLPIIGTTAGAIPDTVAREAGLLVPPGDSEALARALRQVIVEPALRARLAAGSRRGGARLPDWPEVLTQWENALNLFASRDAPV